MTTIINPPNSVWPNGLKIDSEGYVIFYPLGTNKVDISTITWPDGDKLISPFIYDENDKLVGLCDTKAMVVSGATSITLPYSHIEADFSSIEEGDLEVNAPNATVIKLKWAGDESEEGDEEGDIIITPKYKGCKTVDAVKSVDADYQTSDVVDGVWTESLADLKIGYKMFYKCTNLTSFTSDLIYLADGRLMFYNCTNLTSFTSDLGSLIDSEYMFHNCTNLTSFTSDLGSLINGEYMFYDCKLDSASIKNIIDTINTSVSSSSLYLGMGCNNTTEDKDLFAQEIGYNTMTDLLEGIKSKGWKVSAQYNGRPTATYSLRRLTIEGESLPVFVKLEEAAEHTDYTSMDETKIYRLTWFHETTGSTEGYTQYTTLEEAIEALNIKPIERN